MAQQDGTVSVRIDLSTQGAVSGSGGKSGDKESQGTTEYARANGALAVTLECGHHHNADAADIGYRAILRALAHLEMLAPDCEAARSLDAGVAVESQRCVWG